MGGFWVSLNYPIYNFKRTLCPKNFWMRHCFFFFISHLETATKAGIKIAWRSAKFCRFSTLKPRNHLKLWAVIGSEIERGDSTEMSFEYPLIKIFIKGFSFGWYFDWHDDFQQRSRKTKNISGFRWPSIIARSWNSITSKFSLDPCFHSRIKVKKGQLNDTFPHTMQRFTGNSCLSHFCHR